MIWKHSLPVRVIGPTLLTSFLLFGLCIAAAVYLYAQHASSAADLGENVSSAQVAHDLENTLTDLIALLRAGNDKVGPLHQRAEAQLAEARDLADKDDEKRLVAQLQDIWERYLQICESRPGDAVRALEAEALPVCGRLQEFNARQIKKSEAASRKTAGWMTAGLVAVGSMGSVVGLLLGYRVARALRKSIYHLSVRVQDAASKLSQDLPEVALAEDGDLHHLHEQLHGVVHEIEQVVARLQQREHEVLRAEQLAAVGQLAAGVAHELRNPLTSIKMLVQTNREDARARGLPAEDLDVIEREIRRMERSLKTFLDFARPPTPERRPLDLAGPVAQTLALVAGRARKQQVAVHFRRPPGPVTVEADGEQVQQLLVNLVLNALDVMPRGGTLEIDLRPPDHGEVELRVLDTGPGIAAEIAPRLFEPFVSSKEAGLGLGLVISRRIAEGHGGSLRAANRPEGGACFTLRLPLPAAADRGAVHGPHPQLAGR